MKDDKLFSDIEQRVDEAVKKGELSRRDALKVMAFASGGLILGQAPLFADGNETNKSEPKKSLQAKIVIIGGGSGGIDVLARLCHKLDKPDITIIAPNDKHIYQPAQTLVAGGIKEPSDLIRDEKDYIPEEAKWIKTKVASIDPDNNMLKLENGQTQPYDYLVVSPGVELDYDKIVGLADTLNKNGVSSVYTMEGAEASLAATKAFKGGKAIFTNPNTPVKCGGAPQKVMYLFDDYLRLNAMRDKATISYYSGGGKLFAVDDYNKAAMGFCDTKGIVRNFNHNLVEVKADKKIAVFEKKTKIKTGYDKDLEEDIFEEKIDKVEVPYDYLHVVPPMSAAKVVQESKLAFPGGTAKGWMKVDRFTLQSFDYKNVFGMGDAIGTPYGKTGGSARKQAPILVENLISVMEGNAPTKKYNGYTVCPLITRRGRVMLAEFDYDGLAPSFPLDPTQERWIWWILKVYMLEPMYWYGMLRGRM